MEIKIIGDSCLDYTPAIRTTLGLETAPLKITVEDQHFIDDGSIDTKKLVAAMAATKKPITTAAPSPEDFAQLMRKADNCVAITLSRHLSGSYNSAMAAKNIVLEESPEKNILVFDSKTAASGELRIALYIKELVQKGADMEELAKKVPPFIDNMRTFFVLEDLGNLIKNGRIPRMAGMIGTMLMLRPIMGENGDGEIISIEKVRGTQKALDRLVEIVAEKTEKAASKSLLLVLSYCNCLERGLEVKKQILAKCPNIYEVIMVPTSGLSTSYANNGGIIVAFG